MNKENEFIDLRGKTPGPGYYTMVLHYYQPFYPGQYSSVRLGIKKYSSVPVNIFSPKWVCLTWIILHIYLFVEFKLNVIIQNGQFYEAEVPLKHCPSVSGCRAVVNEVNGNIKFNLIENFMITFKVCVLSS